MCQGAISSDDQGNIGIRRNDGELARFVPGGGFESEESLNKRVFDRRQSELDALANQRNQVMQQQQAQSQALQAQQAQAMAEQKSQVTQLRAQQSKKLAEAEATQAANVERLAADQKTKLGGIKSRGQAVSSSLQILGKGSLTGPSATNTTPKASRKGAASTSAQLARGSSRNRGPNLSI